MQTVDDNKKPRISIIAAIGKDRELGFQGGLLWRLPDDLRRFKAITNGHPVVMGRKTWESIPEKFRPLPGRTNIVVTRQARYKAPGATVVDGLSDAFLAAQDAAGADETFVIGGGEIYAAALPYTTRIYLTIVDEHVDADTFFPSYELEYKILEEEMGTGEPAHRFLILERNG